MLVEIEEVIKDEGSIVIFRASNNDHTMDVAIDHRMAEEIVDALAAGDIPEALIEPWQIVRSW